MHLGRPLVFDSTLALLALVGGQLEVSMAATDGYSGGSVVVTRLLGVAMSLPLVLRRRAPVIALSTMASACLVLSLFWEHSLYFWSDLLPLCFAVYPAARLVEGWFGRWSWLIAAVAVDSTMLHTPSAREPSNAVFSVVVLGACAAAGRLVRRSTHTRARLAEALKGLAEEHRVAELTAVREERARIAAEVQDVVAHAVGLMLVQVGAARLALESGTHAVPEQLRAAESTGRRALAELRRSVGALEPAEAPASLEPLPDLAQLPELVRGFRSAGLDVRLDLVGADASALPAGLQLSAYRILQEALTNALRHAGPVVVQAAVRVEDQAVVLEVRNPLGRGARPLPLPSGGHGLLSMRERVSMFDGTLAAGPDGDAFVLRATLPVPHPDAPSPPRQTETVS